MTKLATRISRLAPSPIRDILKVIDSPSMISFAGGLPSPESFPTFDWPGDISGQLQYGASEGEADLRREIAERLSTLGLDTDAERVLILSGSQQGIDLVAKLMIDSGTKVAVETPTYLAALQVFSLFGADYLPYQRDKVAEVIPKGKPALTYTTPTFQKPDGRRLHER